MNGDVIVELCKDANAVHLDDKLVASLCAVLKSYLANRTSGIAQVQVCTICFFSAIMHTKMIWLGLRDGSCGLCVCMVCIPRLSRSE